MFLFFALGFLAFTIMGISGVKEATYYHNDVEGISIMSIASCMSILAMIGCILGFLFIELPLYGIVIWSAWILFN